MAVMVDLHGLRIDVGFQGVKGVGEGREGKRAILVLSEHCAGRKRGGEGSDAEGTGLHGFAAVHRRLFCMGMGEHIDGYRLDTSRLLH
jgi:hypothetical protein